MGKIEDMIATGRSLIGTPYGFWGGGALEPYSPEWTATDYSLSDVTSGTVNCSGFINVIRWIGAGLPPVGGTSAYGNWISPWWNYDPNQTYPPGTLLLEPYVEGSSEGHIVMVSTDSQYILQSTVPLGVNEQYTHAEMNQYTPFSWAGYMPDCPAGATPDPSSLTYPGDTADPKPVAYWMANVASTQYGLPGILPVMCSCVELTQAWEGPGDVKDVTGYLSPVDGCSVGYFQQQADDLGCGTFGWGTCNQLIDATYALNRFCQEAVKYSGQYGTDPDQLGQWCQQVQRSAYPDRYRDTGYPMAQGLLQGWTPAPPVPPVPEEGDLKVAKYTFVSAVKDQVSVDFTNAAVTALEAIGVDCLALNGPDNIAAASKIINDVHVVSAANCLVVGNKALPLLDADAQAAAGWNPASPIWALYGDDGQPESTLKRVRDYALRWIALYGESPALDEDKLLAIFDAVLVGIDAKDYGTMLSDIEKQPDPPPPVLTLEQRVAKLEQEVEDLQKEVVKS